MARRRRTLVFRCDAHIMPAAGTGGRSVAIYVDTSSAVHGKAGLGRYAANLARELHALLGDRVRIFQNSLGRRGPLDVWDGLPPVGVRWGYRPWRSIVWMGQALSLSMDGLLPHGELFHATEHLLPPFRRIPTVLTVHDLIFERLPEHHKPLNRSYLKAAMPLYCRRASAIIAISAHTKADLVELYGVDPAKVTVIPEAAAPHFVPQPAERIAEVRRQYGLPRRYALTVGTIEPRKNLPALLDACRPLLDDGSLDAVVIVGSKGWLTEGFFAKLGACPRREQVILPGYVSDAELSAMYGGAAVTVQPSLYEGFGLPVLEAMACGSPVCASGTTSLPEVGGDAARYFCPTDVQAITRTIRTVLEDETQAARMRQAGPARAAAFSWRRTALETCAVYDRLLER